VPFRLDLAEPWVSRGWKVKIRDRERLETPHVTLLYKARAWRFGLRSETFLDTESDPTEVPKDVMDQVLASLARLRQEWDRMFPGNPISSEGRADE